MVTSWSAKTRLCLDFRRVTVIIAAIRQHDIRRAQLNAVPLDVAGNKDCDTQLAELGVGLSEEHVASVIQPCRLHVDLRATDFTIFKAYASIDV